MLSARPRRRAWTVSLLLIVYCASASRQARTCACDSLPRRGTFLRARCRVWSEARGLDRSLPGWGRELSRSRLSGLAEHEKRFGIDAVVLHGIRGVVALHDHPFD